MATISKGIFGCFSQAWNLEFDSASIQHEARIVMGGQLNGTIEMIAISFLLPVTFITFLLVIFIAGKLRRTHYPEHKFSHVWLMLYVGLSYWIYFLVLLR